MKSKLFRACFAGFLGTIVVTCMVTFASPTLIGGPADLAALLAGMLGGSWLAGLAMHFGVGTLVLAGNVFLLGSYALGCHSLRHLIGGRFDLLSAWRQQAYSCVSCLNARHGRLAALSLFSVAFSDLYVRLCSMGKWSDWRIF